MRLIWEIATPFWALKGRPNVLVPKTACRSVVFIGSVHPEKGFIPHATGFLVKAAEYSAGSMFFPYLVTAEHVVTGMLAKNLEIHCRINLKNGETAFFPLTGKWWSHPTGEAETDLQSDVAIMPFGLREDIVDHEYISLTNRPDHIDRIPRLGEEVFLMGLFKGHHGQRRNIPIIRIGNIAALPEEPIATKDRGDIDAYLVEVRSIAGLSGSPVFKNAEGLMPYPKPKVTSNSAALVDFVDEATKKFKREQIDWFDWHFVGLVHGHFDVKNFTEDAAIEDAIGENNEVNTGIAIVIPASKVLETLFQPALQEEQWTLIRKGRQEHGATADVDLSDVEKPIEPQAAPEADNPNHKEDFTSLLNAAATRKSPAGQT